MDITTPITTEVLDDTAAKVTLPNGLGELLILAATDDDGQPVVRIVSDFPTPIQVVVE